MLRASWALVHLPRHLARRTFDCSTRFISCSPSKLLDAGFRQRYVSAPLDSALFEEVSQDYLEISRDSLLNQKLPLPGLSLRNLVEQGQYEQADKLRREMEELGLEIQRDMVFEQAAKAVLSWPNFHIHASVFYRWLELVPDADPIHPESFRDIRRLLLSAPKQNITVIAQFGSICASKGYIDMVREEILPVLEKFTALPVRAEFIRAIEDEIRSYEETHAVSGPPPFVTTDIVSPNTNNRCQTPSDNRTDTLPMTLYSTIGADGAGVIGSTVSPSNFIQALPVDEGHVSRDIHELPITVIKKKSPLLALKVATPVNIPSASTTILRPPRDPSPHQGHARTGDDGSTPNPPDTSPQTDAVQQPLAFPFSLIPTRFVELPVEEPEHVDPDVLEDTSDEYTKASPRNTQELLTVLTSIENSLPESLPEPIYESPGLFEDESEEDYSFMSPSSSDAPYTSVKLLNQLVQSRAYEEATRILKELRELGVPVPFSWVYEQVAQTILRQNRRVLDIDYNHQAEVFRDWFSLIPPAHGSKPTIFRKTRTLIFSAPSHNIPLIMHFGLICAEKGYGSIVMAQVIPVVIHFTDADIGVQFVKDFVDKCIRYWENADADLGYNARASFQDGYGNAVRTLARADRFDEAMILVQSVAAQSMTLSTYTYDILLHRLRRAADLRYLPYIKELTDLRGHDVRPETSPRIVRRDHSDYDQSEIEMAASFQTEPPARSDGNLSLTLRYLKRLLRRGRTYPHPFTIVHFMQDYSSTGRTRAVHLLRNLACREGHGALSIFAFAELLFMYRAQRYLDLVHRFSRYFYLSGVPRSDVLLAVHRAEKEQEASGEGFVNPVNPVRGKIIPHPVHSALVWHGLLKINTRERDLEILYEKLLGFANGTFLDQPLSLPTSSTSTSVSRYNGKVDSAAFTPFVRRFSYAFGAARTAAVLSDMLKANIQPSVYQFTELAMLYSRTGDVERTFLILGRMEAMIDSKVANTAASADDTGPIDGFSPPSAEKSLTNQQGSNASLRPLDLPPTDLVMYVAIIRGFIKSRRVQAANETKKRMLKRLEHIPAKETSVDAVLKDLEALNEQSEARARNPQSWMR